MIRLEIGPRDQTWWSDKGCDKTAVVAVASCRSVSRNPVRFKVLAGGQQFPFRRAQGQVN